MNNFNINKSVSQPYDGAIAKSFMSNVFSWMTLALIVSGVFAWYFANNDNLFSLIFNLETGGMTIFGYVAMFGPLALVFLMGMRFQHMSFGTMVIIFAVFAALMGISMSTIFLVFTLSSIASVFFISAATFASMALLGYTTNTDLTKFGSILYMALFGVIIASIVNWFMKSPGFDYIISIAGVLIFTGLTAYDVQKLKRIGQGIEYQDSNTNKLVIMGALSLYLDFINLFLFLLRIFGSRK